jgi:S-adenosylmethionine:tRNA ribosyltransferase-isomerase
MNLSDFDYPLPPELIAQQPAPRRSGSRLLHVDGAQLSDRSFVDLPDLLSPRDLLVFNDTRVIPARMQGRKETGGQVEVMVERLIDDFEVMAMLRSSHPPKPGSRLYFDTVATATVVSGREPGGILVRLRFDTPVGPLLARIGRLPLPPYITHEAGPEDDSRYQTVYAREPGAVAAPTAGLHFEESVFTALRVRGIRTAMLTLHVGAGTFLPVRTEDLSKHRMHAERFSIPAATAEAITATRSGGGSVVAVGTTTLRALEASGARPGAAQTDLFITPGYRFQVVDRLITNFHLPRSTLLMLVSAFAGVDSIRRAYAHAIQERYRFFSYGDAMLLRKGSSA